MGRREKRLRGSGPTRRAAGPVSLIVPARNEENALPRLLASLEKQMDAIDEIVIINDRSEDRTADLLLEFNAEYGNRVKIVTLKTHPENCGCNPKQYALLKGIEAAEGEILLFTDADCKVPPAWAELMCSHFQDPAVGLCIGPIQTEGAGRFLYRYQYFDHIFRYFYTAGSAGMGMPTGGFGNNLAVRKKALEEIGGYASIGYSVTEDAALIVAVRERSGFSISAAVSKAAAVTALPQHAWSELSKQERRWSYGAFRSPDFHTVFGYAAVMIFLFAGLIAIPLTFVFFTFFYPHCIHLFLHAAGCGGGGRHSQMPLQRLLAFSAGKIFFSAVFYTYNNFLSFVNIPISWKGKDLDKM